MPYLPQLIQIFRAVFKGREDVFAIRWEKQGKSGYMPAYQYDAAAFRAYQLKGGKLQDFPAKTYRTLSDSEISKHLNGEQQIGIYPLLPDNTSWFIAADFDKDNWLEECMIFLKVCSEKRIPAYLERSRSGKGGHVWVFFESPYPAFKSRKIMASLLEEAELISVFDKGSSFDRLFPNQDMLSGKGLGNLIAQVKPQEVDSYRQARVIIRNTALQVRSTPKPTLLKHFPKFWCMILREIN